MNDLSFTEDDFAQIKPVDDETIKAGFVSVAAAGYRQAANVIERLEQAGAMTGQDTIYFCALTKEEFVRFGRALGTFTKRVDGEHFHLERQFDGGLKFTVFISRATICKRKLVRTEHIPERVIPASTKEIYEWDCTPSVLTPELAKVEPAIAEQDRRAAAPVPVPADDEIPF